MILSDPKWYKIYSIYYLKLIFVIIKIIFIYRKSIKKSGVYKSQSQFRINLQNNNQKKNYYLPKVRFKIYT